MGPNESCLKLRAALVLQRTIWFQRGKRKFCSATSCVNISCVGPIHIKKDYFSICGSVDGKFQPMLICVCLGLLYSPAFAESVASDFASSIYGSLAAVFMVWLDRILVWYSSHWSCSYLHIWLRQNKRTIFYYTVDPLIGTDTREDEPSSTSILTRPARLGWMLALELPYRS